VLVVYFFSILSTYYKMCLKFTLFHFQRYGSDRFQLAACYLGEVLFCCVTGAPWQLLSLTELGPAEAINYLKWLIQEHTANPSFLAVG